MKQLRVAYTVFPDCLNEASFDLILADNVFELQPLLF